MLAVIVKRSKSKIRRFLEFDDTSSVSILEHLAELLYNPMVKWNVIDSVRLCVQISMFILRGLGIFFLFFGFLGGI